MKKLTVFFGMQLITLACYCQAVITKPTTAASVKTIQDFGAIAGDGNDDTWAFIKAGKYFSNLWDINGIPLVSPAVNFDYAIYSAELTIPAGTYDVGKQISVTAGGFSTTYGAVFGYAPATGSISRPSGSAYIYGLELIQLQNDLLNNIDEVIIKGTGLTRPIIRYMDGLTIGYFDDMGTPLFFPIAIPPGPAYDPNFKVSIGDFVSTTNCKNIVIENIEIDGNNLPANTTYNGAYSAELIQSGGSGIYLLNCQNISLTDLYIHHMTLDGLYIKDLYKDPVSYPSQPLSNILINNTICDYNRRQGFSWVGGRNIIVNDSKFNNTGNSVSGIAAGNPAAGLDIEPEKDGTIQLWCIDGTFNNCEFINNTSNGLVNGCVFASGCPNYSKNMNFTDCIFHNVNNDAISITGRAYTFTNCDIFGGFLYGNSGIVAGEETIFNNCDFADEEILSRPGVYNVGKSLVESAWARKMQFNSCSFRTLHASQRLMNIINPSTSESDFHLFSNCTFTISPISNGDDLFCGCVFDGDNTFTNNNTSQHELIQANGIIFTGSNDACNSNDFTMTGKILFTPANTTGLQLTQFVIGRNGIGTASTNGFANLNIGTNSCLYAHWDQVIDVGENSKLINHTNGQILALTGAWNNEGKIILDEGSYTNFNNPLSIVSSTTTDPEFYYHKNASMGLNSVWLSIFGAIYSVFPMSSMTLSSNTRFDGGNAAVPSGYESSVNDAVLMDGINDYIGITNPSAFSKLSTYALSGNFSIEISFKKDNNSRSEVLFAQGPDFNIAFKLGQLVYTLPLVGSGSYGEITPVMVDNTCHFLTLTREADDYIRVYLDGSLIHTSSQTYTANISNINDIYLGRGITLTPAPLQGWVGRFRIWDRALTASDICYNHQRKKSYNVANLIGDWDMRDLSGTSATDAAASPISGTLINGASWVTQNTVGDCTEASFQNNLSGNNPIKNPDNLEIQDRIDKITVSPNPGNGDFMLTASGISSENLIIELYDMNGKLIYTELGRLTSTVYKKQFHLKLSAGVYLLMLKDKNNIRTKKLIIQ